MEKDVTSIAKSYYLHIKLIGGNSQSNYLHKDFHQFLLEGHVKLSETSSGNAMCQWVNLLAHYSCGSSFILIDNSHVFTFAHICFWIKKKNYQ